MKQTVCSVLKRTNQNSRPTIQLFQFGRVPSIEIVNATPSVVYGYFENYEATPSVVYGYYQAILQHAILEEDRIKKIISIQKQKEAKELEEFEAIERQIQQEECGIFGSCSGASDTTTPILNIQPPSPPPLQSQQNKQQILKKKLQIFKLRKKTTIKVQKPKWKFY